MGVRSCVRWYRRFALLLAFTLPGAWTRRVFTFMPASVPLAFIVSAEEAIVRLRRFHEQEQVSIMLVALEHVQFALGFALGGDLHLEELAPFVGDNIDGIITAAATPGQIFWTNDPEPRAHAGELIRNRFGIHNLSFNPHT